MKEENCMSTSLNTEKAFETGTMACTYNPSYLGNNGKVKLSLFVDAVILYEEISKNSKL